MSALIIIALALLFIFLPESEAARKKRLFRKKRRDCMKYYKRYQAKQSSEDVSE